MGLLLAVSGASAAQAVFDMLLMAGEQGIHRYNPQGNAYLGKFAQNDGPILDIAPDHTHAGEVLSVTASGVVKRYNIYSGQLLSSFTIPAFTNDIRPKLSVMNDGRLLITTFEQSSNQSAVKIYTNSGDYIRTFATGYWGRHYSDALQLPNGGIMLNHHWNFNWDWFGSTLFCESENTDIQDAHEWLYQGWYYNESLDAWGNWGVVTPGRYIDDYRAGYVAISPMYWSGGYMKLKHTVDGDRYSNWTFGQNEWAYLVQGVGTSSNTNLLCVYDIPQRIGRYPGVNIGTNDRIKAVAVLSVPEPGAWIGLGVGCLGILMRRKRRARS